MAVVVGKQVCGKEDLKLNSADAFMGHGIPYACAIPKNRVLHLSFPLLFTALLLPATSEASAFICGAS